LHHVGGLSEGKFRSGGYAYFWFGKMPVVLDLAAKSWWKKPGRNAGLGFLNGSIGKALFRVKKHNLPAFNLN
jgi:hypothetical protein